MKSNIIKGIVLLCITLINISCGQSAEKSATDPNQNSAQPRNVGGGCETCEIMYIDMPAEINSVDTSAAWSDNGQKLKINGKVYHKDGTSPASDVIIYYWHTDETGRYTPDENMNEKAARHGHIRGWVKTNKQGEYTLYTMRPAAYPDGAEPEHIHFLVKEPDIANEYYIDDIVFSDDSLLAKSIKRRPLSNRGGSGIVNVRKEAEMQIADHKIILGINIPGYK